MDNQPARYDPIGDKYFSAVRIADKWASRLFFISAAFSFAVLYDGWPSPALPILQACFAISVISLFVVGIGLRLYWLPRAEDKRRQDFLSIAFGVHLTHDETVGYYNNDQTNPHRKVAAQLLENSLFSKTITLRMAQNERVVVVAYIAIWLVALLNRETAISLLVTATQVIFSEQLLSRWLRLEWLRMRFEAVYDAVYRLFQSRTAGTRFSAQAMDFYSDYETAKAVGAITLSSRLFIDLNPSLSQEWERIKKALQVQ